MIKVPRHHQRKRLLLTHSTHPHLIRHKRCLPNSNHHTPIGVRSKTRLHLLLCHVHNLHVVHVIRAGLPVSYSASHSPPIRIHHSIRVDAPHAQIQIVHQLEGGR